MQDFRDYPRLSEEERRILYEVLKLVCTLVQDVNDRIEGTYDGQMTFGLETTVADHLWPCLALYDARDAMMEPKALKRKEKRAQAKREHEERKRAAKGGE